MTLSSDEISVLNENKVPWGACYSYDPAGNVTCSQTLQSNCAGWYLDGVTCNPSSVPNLNRYGNSFWVSDPITAATANSYSIGSDFSGGIYCGLFMPSNITYNDNINTLTSTDSTNYAIILYPDIFPAKYINKPINSNTSNYNGRLNVELNITRDPISPNVDNVFKDWYYASICELKFIKTKYIQNFSLRQRISSLFGSTSANISSSSVFSIKSPTQLQKQSKLNTNYLYGTSIKYDSNFLITPYVESNFFVIRSIEISG